MNFYRTNLIMTSPIIKDIPAKILVKELERRSIAQDIPSITQLQGAKDLAVALDERMFREPDPNQQELSGLDQPCLITK